MERIRVSDVRIGPRHRKDLGNIAALANSIKELGLLNPITVTPDLTLIAGHRRLAAVKELGWMDIPAHMVDLKNLVRGEHDENTCRKDFTPSEAVAISKALEELERPRAARRKAAGLKRNKQTAPSGSGNLPEAEVTAEDKGQTRDKVAAAVGMSGKTLEKAKAVMSAAEEDPERYGHLVEQMDRTGKVDPAFKQLANHGGNPPSPSTAILADQSSDPCPANQPAVAEARLQIPEQLKRRFNAVPLFDEAIQAANNLAKVINKIKRTPVYTEKMSWELKSIKTSKVREILQEVKKMAPNRVCLTCRGDSGSDECSSCAACNSKGYLTNEEAAKADGAIKNAAK